MVVKNWVAGPGMVMDIWAGPGTEKAVYFRYVLLFFNLTARSQVEPVNLAFAFLELPEKTKSLLSGRELKKQQQQISVGTVALIQTITPGCYIRSRHKIVTDPVP